MLSFEWRKKLFLNIYKIGLCLFWCDNQKSNVKKKKSIKPIEMKMCTRTKAENQLKQYQQKLYK